jgi:hypothetical protein
MKFRAIFVGSLLAQGRWQRRNHFQIEPGHEKFTTLLIYMAAMFASESDYRVGWYCFWKHRQCRTNPETLSLAVTVRIDNSVRTTADKGFAQVVFHGVSLLLGASCNDVLPCEVQYLLCNTHIDLLCKHPPFRLEFWLKPATQYDKSLLDLPSIPSTVRYPVPSFVSISWLPSVCIITSAGPFIRSISELRLA